MLQRVLLLCILVSLLCIAPAGGQETRKDIAGAIEAWVKRLRSDKPPAKRDRLGVTLQRHQGRGFLVKHVAPGSPAEKAGIRPGDTIIGHGDHAFLHKNLKVEQLTRVVSTAQAGKPVIVVVMRDDQARGLSVTYDGPMRPTLALSPQQKKLVDQLGYPDTFVLLCHSETVKGKTKDIRGETWFYYHLLTNFTFINGKLSASGPIEKLPDDLVYPTYRPEMFRAGMSLTEIKALLGDTPGSLVNVRDLELGDKSLESAQFYVAGQVSMILVEDALCYVLTTPGDPKPAGKEVAK